MDYSQSFQDVAKHVASLMDVPLQNLRAHYINDYGSIYQGILKHKTIENNVGMPDLVSRTLDYTNIQYFAQALLHKETPSGIRYYVYFTPTDNPHPFEGAGHAVIFYIEGHLHKIFLSIRKNKKLVDLKTPILDSGLLKDVVDSTIGFFQNRRKVKKYSSSIRRGIILSGKPGNGKTLLCKYIKNLCLNKKIGYNNVSSSKLLDAFKNDNLTSLFNFNGITFFDDIDISILNREKGDGKLACSILSAMDGIEDAVSCVRIFTTNEDVTDLDKAFLRPGRIDKIYKIKQPDAEMRKRFFEIWHEDIRNSSNFNIQIAIEATEGMSFAEIEMIKSIMVSNFLSIGEWNFDNALKEFHVARDSKITDRKPLGFVAAT